MTAKATTPDLDDIDALLAEPERPGGKECHVCWGLNRIDPNDRDRLAAVVMRKDIAPKKVRPLFAARLDGWAPGDSSFTRHRDGGCTAS